MPTPVVLDYLACGHCCTGVNNCLPCSFCVSVLHGLLIEAAPRDMLAQGRLLGIVRFCWPSLRSARNLRGSLYSVQLLYTAGPGSRSPRLQSGAQPQHSLCDAILQIAWTGWRCPRLMSRAWSRQKVKQLTHIPLRLGYPGRCCGNHFFYHPCGPGRESEDSGHRARMADAGACLELSAVGQQGAEALRQRGERPDPILGGHPTPGPSSLPDFSAGCQKEPHGDGGCSSYYPGYGC